VSRYRVWWVSGKEGDPPEFRIFQQVTIIGYMPLQEMVSALTSQGMAIKYKKLETEEI
jgi:hypothetical protein